MKKRIIALFLLVVMLSATLVSCSFNYSKENMADYVDFDSAAFGLALSNLVVSDADYSNDPAIREKKLNDSILTALLKAVDEENDKKMDGVPTTGDQLYYCYYATIKVGDDTNGYSDVVIYAANMKESSAKAVQFGLTTNEGFTKLVEDKFKDFDITNYAYSTGTDAQSYVQEGAMAFISYKKSVTAFDDAGVLKVTDTNYSYECVKVGPDASHELMAKLWANAVDKDGVKVLYQGAKDAVDCTVDDGNGNKLGTSYSDIRIEWVVNSGMENKDNFIKIEDTTFTEAKSEKDINGNTHELKDKLITYYVFPVYYYDTKDFSAEAILSTIYSTLSSTDVNTGALTYVLKCLESQPDAVAALEAARTVYSDSTSGEVKKHDDAVAAYEAALKEKDTKEAEYYAAKTEYEKDVNNEENKNKYDAAMKAYLGTPELAPDDEGYVKGATKALEEAIAARDAAKNGMDSAKIALDSAIANVINLIGEEVIKEDYKKVKRGELSDEYNAAIKQNVAKALWEKMNEYMTVKYDAIPKRAIREIYNLMIDKYEYDFYQGTSTSGSGDSAVTTSNFENEAYNKKFSEYLRIKLGCDTYENAKHIIWQRAKEYVAETMKIYTLAQTFEYIGLRLTDEETKNVRENLESMEELYAAIGYNVSYNKDDAIIAAQFDKIMNHFLSSETIDEADGNKTVNYHWVTVVVTSDK